MTIHPFRFGVTAVSMASRQVWQDNARLLEESGYAVLTVMDHLAGATGIWSPLLSAHEAAPTLRLGTLVLNNDMWNPAVLAREATSLDILTGGKFELGIGAGWDVRDYTVSGIHRDEPGVRINRLAESLRVLRQAFDGEPMKLAGEHYDIDGGAGLPRPVQPRLPLLVGGGSPKVLRLAAQHADIVSIHRNLQNGAAASWAAETAGQGEYSDAVTKRIGWVQAAAPERFDTLELHALILKSVITNHRDDAYAQLAESQSLPEEHLRSSPHFLVGTEQEIVDDLLARRERWGISYWTLAPGNDAAAFAPVVRHLKGM